GERRGFYIVCVISPLEERYGAHHEPVTELINGTTTQGNTPSLADDIIWGAAAIAAEIGLSQRQVFWHLENGRLPARKVGRIWVASRQQLRAHLFGEAA